MKQKHNKITIVVFISLLAVSLIGTLIFKLPSVSVEWARLIHNNPITDTLESIYWDGLPSLVSIPIAFSNVVCAIIGLYSMYKGKTSTPKRIIGYLVYTLISLGALVIHWLTFVYVIKCVLAG